MPGGGDAGCWAGADCWAGAGARFGQRLQLELSGGYQHLTHTGELASAAFFPSSRDTASCMRFPRLRRWQSGRRWR